MGTAAQDLMRTEVVTVRSDLPLPELADVLLQHKIQGAPVVDDGKLVGIVSRSDVVRQMKVEEERISDSAFYFEPFDADDRRAEDRDQMLQSAASRVPKLLVRDLMITDLVTVSPETPLEEVARRMVERRIHRVLVTQDGALCGIVSGLDFVALFVDGRATLR